MINDNFFAGSNSRVQFSDPSEAGLGESPSKNHFYWKQALWEGNKKMESVPLKNKITFFSSHSKIMGGTLGANNKQMVWIWHEAPIVCFKNQTRFLDKAKKNDTIFTEFYTGTSLDSCV